MEAEINIEEYIVLQVKYPYLLTDGTQIYIASNACVESAKCEVS